MFGHFTTLCMKGLTNFETNIPSKIGFQVNEDKNNNGVALETGC